MVFNVNPLIGGLSFSGGLSVMDSMNYGAAATGTPGYSLMPGGLSLPTFGFGAPRTSYWGSPEWRGVADIAIGSNDLQRGTPGLGLGGFGGLGYPFVMGPVWLYSVGSFDINSAFSMLAQKLSSASNMQPAGPSSYTPSQSAPALSPEPVEKKSEPDVGDDKSADKAADEDGNKTTGKKVDEAKVRQDFNVPGVKVLGVTDDGRVRLKPEDGYSDATARRPLDRSLRKLHRDGVKEVVVGDTSNDAIPVWKRTGSKTVPVMVTGEDGKPVQAKDDKGQPVVKKVSTYGPNTKAILDALRKAAPPKTEANSPALSPADAAPASVVASASAPAGAASPRRVAASVSDAARSAALIQQSYLSRMRAKANQGSAVGAEVKKRGNEYVLSIPVKNKNWQRAGMGIIRALKEASPSAKPVAIELVAATREDNAAAKEAARIVNERVGLGNSRSGAIIIVREKHT